MASFIRINGGESIDTVASATSQAFYVIRGKGSSVSELGTVEWNEGDLFVLPQCDGKISHSAAAAAAAGGAESAALYWVTDAPLLSYLGVRPSERRFQLTVYRRSRLLEEVERIKHQPGAEHRCVPSSVVTLRTRQRHRRHTLRARAGTVWVC